MFLQAENTVFNMNNVNAFALFQHTDAPAIELLGENLFLLARLEFRSLADASREYHNIINAIIIGAPLYIITGVKDRHEST